SGAAGEPVDPVAPGRRQGGRAIRQHASPAVRHCRSARRAAPDTQHDGGRPHQVPSYAVLAELRDLAPRGSEEPRDAGLGARSNRYRNTCGLTQRGHTQGGACVTRSDSKTLFLGMVEVDGGTLVIGDPGYMLPRASQHRPGIDYQAVINAPNDMSK